MDAKRDMSREELEGVLVDLKGQFQLSEARIEGEPLEPKVALYASKAQFVPLVGKAPAISGKLNTKAAEARASYKAGDYLRATVYDGPLPTSGAELAQELDNRVKGQLSTFDNGTGVSAIGAGPNNEDLFDVEALAPNDLDLKTSGNPNQYLRAGSVEAKSSVPRGTGRSGAGETVFGHFGVDEETLLTGGSNTKYNGGHLVGDQIMDSHHPFDLYEDWNLAPQARSFNSPIYTGAIENAVTKTVRSGGTVQYNVRIQYPDNTYDVTPSNLDYGLFKTNYGQQMDGAIENDANLDNPIALRRRTPGFAFPLLRPG